MTKIFNYYCKVLKLKNTSREGHGFKLLSVNNP